MVVSSQPKKIKVLIVDGDQEQAGKLTALLEISKIPDFEAIYVGHLNQAIDYLRSAPVDALLLSLNLPDSQGIDSFFQIHSSAADIPVIIISDMENKSEAIDVIREGAQDYLVKKELRSDQLVYSVLYALERHRVRHHLQQISFQDELTGLLNRRGFISLAQQHIKVANRENWGLLMIFADLDGLKEINDRFGHPEGDHALRAVGTILSESFRTSDIVARLGGDEFVVLAINFANAEVDTIKTRLTNNLNQYNAANPKYKISLSYGIARFEPRSGASLEEMIAEADERLYSYKRTKG